tara:strand:+ start:296 stop:799 length:504 start_codon:yes stop_codon:yes gene_type:complete
MIKSYLSAWKKSFDFKGKTTRKEYWQFLILNSIIFGFLFLPILIGAYYFNDFDSLPVSVTRLFLPIYSIVFLSLFGSIWVTLPLTVRRIRDVGMSWKWIFFVSLPYVGSVFVLIFLTRSSMVVIDGNEYYLRYPTKKIHIIGYWIAAVASLGLYVTPLIIALISYLK